MVVKIYISLTSGLKEVSWCKIGKIFSCGESRSRNMGVSWASKEENIVCVLLAYAATVRLNENVIKLTNFIVISRITMDAYDKKYPISSIIERIQCFASCVYEKEKYEKYYREIPNRDEKKNINFFSFYFYFPSGDVREWCRRSVICDDINKLLSIWMRKSVLFHPFTSHKWQRKAMKKIPIRFYSSYESVKCRRSMLQDLRSSECVSMLHKH